MLARAPGFSGSIGTVRGPLALAVIAGALVGWACSTDAFTCSSDAECSGGPTGGTCEEGYCAFPSEVCSSGLQWGDHAGEASGTCVPPSGTDGSEGSSSEGSSSAATSLGPGVTSLDDAPPDPSADSSEGPSAGDLEFRDDALEGEFGAGTMQGVAWTGDRLTLDDDSSVGSFTSRVFDAGDAVTWKTVQWQPDAPYGKPLPDGGGVEVGYVEGGADMAASVLLMHFDDDGAVAWDDGAVVPDASGLSNDGEVHSPGPPIALVPGIFGTAIDDLWETRITIPTAQAPSLAFDEDDFSWALWVRTSSGCTSNQVYMGVDDNNDAFDIGPHLWLGCTTDGWFDCAGNVTAPRGAGVMRAIHDFSGDGGSYCSETAIDGDVWRHLAVVKEGHDPGTLRLYVDGALEDEDQVSFMQPITYPNDPDFTIGAFSRDTYRAVGVLDEVVVWRRALGSDEVAGVYQRGVTSLHVLVRVCQDAACADDPPWGLSYVDPPQALAAGGELALDGLENGRYVQYRLELAGPRPALRSVVIRGVVP